MILCDREKKIDIGDLEDVCDYMIGMYDGEYTGETVRMLAVLYQINLIIEKFYLNKESDIKQLYRDLRKRILPWLKESNIKPEVNNEERIVINCVKV